MREYVADVQKKVTKVQKDVQTRFAGVQKNVKGFEFEPKVVREQTVTVVNSRVSELRSDAKAQVEKVQTLVNENVATVTDTYGDLAKRGEQLVGQDPQAGGHQGHHRCGEDDRREGQDHQDAGQEDRQEGQLEREGDPHLREEDRVERRQGDHDRRFEGRQLK